MNRVGYLCLGYLIIVSWAFGGGVWWGPWFVGGGGLCCLVSAIVAARRDGPIREMWSWRVLPWLLWIVFVGISVSNPSHQLEAPEYHGQFTKAHGGTAGDTLGLATPVVAVEHIEWLPASSDPVRTGRYLFTTAGMMAFALALVLCPMNRREIRHWLTIVFVNSLALTGAGLWFYTMDKELIFGRFETEGSVPFASFHYKNCWAAYAVLSAAIGIGLGYRLWRSGVHVFEPKSPVSFFVLSCPFLLLSMVVCESRAGLLLSALMIAWLFLVLSLQTLRERENTGPRGLKMAALAVLLAGLGWYIAQTAAPQLDLMFSKSTDQVAQVSADEPTGRMVLIRDTIKMALEKPWFGWGLATFSQVYPLYQGPELFIKVTFRGGEDYAWAPAYYEFAHCDWVQYWAETGAIGLLLLLATPLAWYVHGLRRGRSNPLSHWLGVGGLLVLVLATFEFPFGCEAVALLFGACLALAGKYALLAAQKSRRRSQRER